MSPSTAACLERIVAALPGITIDRWVRSLKCVVAFGTLAGARVCVKTLHHADPIWAWYFERERVVLGRLPHDVAAPRLRALVDGLIVVDELPGAPLARHRRVERSLPRELVIDCLALADRVQTLELGHVEPPGPPLVRALRERLLEDPSAPLGWFHAGFDRCATLGLVSARQAAFMHAALDAYDEVRTCHGDFLPRNLLVDEQLCVSACDWECAGLHARDWDRALLWANLDPRDHAPIEASVAEPHERALAFRALAGFATARELAFAGRAPQARRDALALQLARVLGPA